MSIDFLSILNNTNSIKNEATGEITITTPILQSDDKYQINSSCIITSNCNTIIKSDFFEILSSSVSISNISFETAIFIQDSNNVSITNCSIKNAKKSYGAITIFNSQEIYVNNVTITETNDIPGIFVYKNSLVKADHLLIHDITKSFIAINSNSFMSIKNSIFHHTQRNAIYLADHSNIEIFNCTFSNVIYPSLYFVDSNCIIQNNTFQDLSENAIVVQSSSGFLIEKNIFNHIGDTAIQISNDSKGIIKNNTIFNAKGNGIYCHKSDICIENNEIYDLTYPAIGLSSKSKCLLVGNKISNVKCNGISIRHANEVIIKDCEVKNIDESGISISDTESCFIQNNKITNCIISSIESYNRSNVTVTNNVISNIEKNAFLCYTSGFMKAINNQISDVKNEFVKLTYKGCGEFVNNQIVNCIKQCYCQNSSFFFFSGNGDFKNITNDQKKFASNKSIDFVDSFFDDEEIFCIKCHTKKRNTFILDCGHKVFCQECAQESLRNKEKCPLCRFPIVKVSNGFGSNIDDTCIICCENRSDSIILPCGHMGVCSSCLENWINTNQSCPICRSRPCIYKQVIHDF